MNIHFQYKRTTLVHGIHMVLFNIKEIPRYILIRFISNIKELHIHQFRMTLKFSFLYCEHCSPCSKTGNLKTPNAFKTRFAS